VSGNRVEDHGKYTGGDNFIDNIARAQLCKTCQSPAKIRMSKIHQTYILQCTKCSKRTLDFQDPKRALDAWNTTNK